MLNNARQIDVNNIEPSREVLTERIKLNVSIKNHAVLDGERRRRDGNCVFCNRTERPTIVAKDPDVIIGP